jgi:hypothetical protein
MNTTLRRGAVVVLLILSAACSGPTAPTLTTPTVSSLGISFPSGQTPAVGRAMQLTATARLSDGTTRDVTTQAAWRSTSGVAAVTAGGVVTFVTDGCVTITASYQQVIAGFLLFTTSTDAGCWDY